MTPACPLTPPHTMYIPPPPPRPTIFEDLEPDEPSSKGRITAMTLAEGLDRKKIESLLKAKYPKLEIHTYQDVVHATPHLDDPTSGDIFFFDVRGRGGLLSYWEEGARGTRGRGEGGGRAVKGAGVHATPHLDDPTSCDIFFLDVRGCGGVVGGGG